MPGRFAASLSNFGERAQREDESLRKADVAEQVGVARIRTKSIPLRVHLEEYQLGRPLFVGFFQPEGGIISRKGTVPRSDGAGPGPSGVALLPWCFIGAHQSIPEVA
jgi:hypothetical protein